MTAFFKSAQRKSVFHDLRRRRAARIFEEADDRGTILPSP